MYQRALREGMGSADEIYPRKDLILIAKASFIDSVIPQAVSILMQKFIILVILHQNFKSATQFVYNSAELHISSSYSPSLTLIKLLIWCSASQFGSNSRLVATKNDLMVLDWVELIKSDSDCSDLLIASMVTGRAGLINNECIPCPCRPIQTNV